MAGGIEQAFQRVRVAARELEAGLDEGETDDRQKDLEERFDFHCLCLKANIRAALCRN